MRTNYIHTFSNEFTNGNYYVLTFTLNETFDASFIFGHDPNLTTKDGVYISKDTLNLYRDDELLDTVTIPSISNSSMKIVRKGDEFVFFKDDVQIYSTTLISWNTVGVYNTQIYSSFNVSDFEINPYVGTDITPSVNDYDGSIYGSDLHLELRNDHLNLTDYGMLPSGAVGGAKIMVEDVPLPTDDLELQLEMKYNNTRFERLNNLTGEMQIRVYEDISTSDSVKEYSKVFCSPMPVQNVKTVFTRHSEEGILYYIRNLNDVNPNYLCNAYNLYKGGCNISSETGIQLFDLDNAFSPVYVGNNLVRAEFHRRSGYIVLSKYNEDGGGWINVNTLKLSNYPQLTLVEYNDDYCELKFGDTTWKFYRGRPFIVCNHKNNDFRVLNLVDRVYCETFENDRNMGFIEEHDATCSIFNPQLSIQQFKQELHIGENIRLDNFEIYDIDSNHYIGEVNTDSALSIVQVEDENALLIDKNNNSHLALNFPSYSNYVKRVNSTFTLLIGYVDSNISSFTIKARGFDDKGAVPVTDGIQYGIWEQSHNVTVDTTNDDEIRVTFTDCPSTVKYLDFIIELNTNNSADVVMKDFMYYEGDSELNHDIDTSIKYAEQVDIRFNETYYANLYNEDDSYGLCIIRPNQHHISLKTIYADKETVFAPYMKKSAEWDKPSQIFLEYLNSKRQVIDIDWEN